MSNNLISAFEFEVSRIKHVLEIVISDTLILREKTKGYSFGDSEMRKGDIETCIFTYPYSFTGLLFCCIVEEILHFEDETMWIDEVDDDLLSKIAMTSNYFNLISTNAWQVTIFV